MQYYTVIGYFPVLKRRMDKEFKRVGFGNIKEKRWFLHKVLGYAPTLKGMTITEMEKVISELGQYNNIDEIN
ncbi:hypothetical protein [Bacillus haynesii]|uniref:hypothetical protein n=1 Tax=Bacillus haynesii TaxID=1925021 RepID=UPI00227DAAF3|nr:hypothetical protein [Bacillus haynesii]MCY9156354.1 hypothetical protein [Bacillus haynesii]MCY9452958.1 hypothetical protein [Bacillus haynesii]